MPHTDRMGSIRRARRVGRIALRLTFLAAFIAAAHFLQLTQVAAHEGHDHDKPPALNLPVAPRVLAVTPDYELVGVRSGQQRLTIFLHRFETNEPVKDAKLTLSVGEREVEAVAQGDGVFEISAPWISSSEPLDIIFKLTLPNDQDILTGRLESGSVANAAGGPEPRGVIAQYQTLVVGVVALMVGVLLTLLVGASFVRRRHMRDQLKGPDSAPRADEVEGKVKHLRRAPIALLGFLLAAALLQPSRAVAQGPVNLPSVPATMATDAPQRMADGSLFVPKATQHLLSVRTVLTAASQAPRTLQLVGTVIADPNSFGRVQTGHAGRIETPNSGLPFVGKRVEKGEVLTYLEHHIEAYNKGNLQGEIAELEARIALQEAKLARYLKAPLAVPPIRIDETKGEINALRQRRKELMPTLVEREEIRAPITGIISAANVVAGQVVDAREVLFEIVDPARYWVEAIAHDPGVVDRLSKATAVLSDGGTVPLEFAGLGPSLKQQAASLTFRVVQAPRNISVGRPVTVILQSTEEIMGIVLPASSVVRAPSGLSIVWVKTEPERFEPHSVRYEPLDGHRVVVSAGLKADMRVVTEGATLINQIR